MSTLLTPSIERISAFNPSEPKIVNFSYTGNQVTKNRAVITDNETNVVVYDMTISTMKLAHTIPKDTLDAGRQYFIQIQVLDDYGNKSELSKETLFYCFTTPEFDFGISDPYRSASITLSPTYYQEQGETLKYHQYMLYDNNNNLLSSSDVYYGNIITPHTFYGLDNNRLYYARCIAETTQGMPLDTGKKKIDVQYKTIPANILFQLENYPCSGYIDLRTNMLVIGYELENDNFTFNNDGSVTLWDNSVTYKGGFEVEGDFVLYIDAKEIPLGVFLKTAEDEFTLSIADVCGSYYCEFKSGEYVIYVPLPNAQLTSTGIRLDDDFIIFELKRINNVYGLKAYYKADL